MAALSLFHVHRTELALRHGRVLHHRRGNRRGTEGASACRCAAADSTRLRGLSCMQAATGTGCVVREALI